MPENRIQAEPRTEFGNVVPAPTEAELEEAEGDLGVEREEPAAEGAVGTEGGDASAEGEDEQSYADSE